MHDRFLMLRSRILEAELPRDFRLLSFCELCFGVEAAMFTILRLDIAAACESLPVMRDDGARHRQGFARFWEVERTPRNRLY